MEDLKDASEHQDIESLTVTVDRVTNNDGNNDENEKPSQMLSVVRLCDWIDQTVDSISTTVLYGKDINQTGISMNIRSVVSMLRRNFKLILPLKILIAGLIRPTILYFTSDDVFNSMRSARAWIILVYLLYYCVPFFLW